MTRPNEEPEPWPLRLAKFRARLAGFHLPRVEPKHLRHLYGERCKDCDLRVVRASGELIAERCGACHNAWQERQDFPPAA